MKDGVVAEKIILELLDRIKKNVTFASPFRKRVLRKRSRSETGLE